MNEFAFEEIGDHNLSELLDKLFPGAKSRQQVEHDGRTFRRRFRPKFKQDRQLRSCGKFGAGKVKVWDTYWEEQKLLDSLTSIDAKLNHLFPNASKGTEISFEGKRYRLSFSPVFSRSYKTIHSWEKYWAYIGDDSIAATAS